MTTEKIGIILGIAIPSLAGLIWYGALVVSDVNELEKKAATFEARIHAIEQEQAQMKAAGEAVNKQVEIMAEEVEWLQYHHHDEVGLHKDGEPVVLGRGHVD